MTSAAIVPTTETTAAATTTDPDDAQSTSSESRTVTLAGCFQYVMLRCNTYVTLLVFSCLTTILAILSVSHCSFVIGIDHLAQDNQPHMIGLFSWAVLDPRDYNKILGCVAFPPHVQMDAHFRLSRVAGTIMTVNMTGTFLLLLWTILFHQRGPTSTFWLWKCIRSGMVMATVSGLFAFTILQSDHCSETDCELSNVGVATAFNVFLMASLTLIVCLEPPPHTPWLELWTDNHFIDRDQKPDSLARCHVKDQIQFGGPTPSSSNDDNSRSFQDIEEEWKAAAEKKRVSSVAMMRSVKKESREENEDDDDDFDVKSQSSAGSIVGFFFNSTVPHAASSLPTSRTATTATEDSIRCQNVSFGDVHESLVGASQHNNRLQHSLAFRLCWLMSLAGAWMMSVLGVHNCTFLRWGGVEDTSLTLELGLYTRAFYMDGKGKHGAGCIAYNSRKDAGKEFDNVFQAARVFGAVAALLMSIVLVLTMAQCLSKLCCRLEMWLFLRSLLPFAALSQALTMLVFSSDLCSRTTFGPPTALSLEERDAENTESNVLKCVPGAIGYTVMVNVVLILSQSLICCWLPPPSNPIFARFRDEFGHDENEDGKEEEHEVFTSPNTKMIRSIKPSKTSRLGTIMDEQESVASETDGLSTVQEDEVSVFSNDEIVRNAAQQEQHPLASSKSDDKDTDKQDGKEHGEITGMHAEEDEEQQQQSLHTDGSNNNISPPRHTISPMHTDEEGHFEDSSSDQSLEEDEDDDHHVRNTSKKNSADCSVQYPAVTAFSNSNLT